MFHLRTAQTLGLLGEVIRIELVWVGEVSLVMVDPVDGKAQHVVLLQLQPQTIVSLACVKGRVRWIKFSPVLRLTMS